MKKLLGILALILLTFSPSNIVAAKNSDNFNYWHKSYSAVNFSTIYGFNKSVVDNSGNLILGMVGKRSSISGTTNLLTKVSSFGDVIWSRSLGGLPIIDLRNTNDGGFLILTRYYDSLQNKYISVVYKFRPDDALDWKYEYNAEDEMQIHGILPDSNGGYLLYGQTLIESPTAKYATVTIHLNDNGDMEWKKVFNFEDLNGTIISSDSPRAIQTPSGNFVLNTSSYYGGGYLIKISANGEFLDSILVRENDLGDAFDSFVQDGNFLINAFRPSNQEVALLKIQTEPNLAVDSTILYRMDDLNFGYDAHLSRVFSAPNGYILSLLNQNPYTTFVKVDKHSDQILWSKTYDLEPAGLVRLEGVHANSDSIYAIGTILVNSFGSSVGSIMRLSAEGNITGCIDGEHEPMTIDTSLQVSPSDEQFELLDLSDSYNIEVGFADHPGFSNLNITTETLCGAGNIVSGSITDSEGKPLANVPVIATEGNTTIGSTVTDANGDYKFINLDSGMYNIKPDTTERNFSPAFHVVTVPPDVDGINFAALAHPCHDDENFEISRLPLLLIHGWGGPDSIHQDDSGFMHMIDEFRNDGFIEGCNLFYARGIRSENSQRENIAIVQANLQLAYAQYLSINPAWRGHFNMIGHSYGGLNARFYLESSSYKDDRSFDEYGIHINNLFTLGTPHGGVRIPEELYPGAFVIASTHIVDLEDFELQSIPEIISALKLSSIVREAYNKIHSQPEGTCYRLIGGDFLRQSNVISDFLKDMYSSDLWDNNPSDIGVSIRSATELGINKKLVFDYPAVQVIENKDMHGYLPLLSHLHSYVRANEEDPISTYKASISPILTSTNYSCPPTSSNSSVDSDENLRKLDSESDPEPILLRRSTTFTADPISGTVSIDWSGRTVFYTTWNGFGNINLEIQSPEGVIINPEVATNNPNIEFGVVNFGSFGIASYTLEDASPGIWSYTLTPDSEKGVPMLATDLYVYGENPIYFDAAAPEWGAFGTEIEIKAELKSNASVIANASVRAEIARPDSSKVTIELRDDGIFPDEVKDDGIYSESYKSTYLSGDYLVVARTTGLHNNLPFERTSQTVFSIGEADIAATLENESFTDYGIDEDDDGHYEYLAIETSFTANQPGTYSLIGNLQSESGELIDSTHATIEATIGTNKVLLVFSGKNIYESRMSGSYSLTDLTLVEHDNTLILDRKNVAWITQPFSYTDFAGNHSLFLPIILYH